MDPQLHAVIVAFAVVGCVYGALFDLGKANESRNASDETVQTFTPQTVLAENMRKDFQLFYSYNVKDPLMMGNVFRMAFAVSNISSSERRVSIDFVADDLNVLRFELVYNHSIGTNMKANGTWDHPQEQDIRGFTELFAPDRKIYLDFYVIDQFTYFVNLNREGAFILRRFNKAGAPAASEVRRIDVTAWAAHVVVDTENVLLVNCKGHGL